LYNAGDNREGSEAFKARMNECISLSHPNVIAIVGIVAPTKGTDPIILPPYRRYGSLEDPPSIKSKTKALTVFHFTVLKADGRIPGQRLNR
jgi:hypothetical protein